MAKRLIRLGTSAFVLAVGLVFCAGAACWDSDCTDGCFSHSRWMLYFYDGAHSSAYVDHSDKFKQGETEAEVAYKTFVGIAKKCSEIEYGGNLALNDTFEIELYDDGEPDCEVSITNPDLWTTGAITGLRYETTNAVLKSACSNGG